MPKPQDLSDSDTTPQYSVDELKMHLSRLAARMRFPPDLEAAFRRHNYLAGRSSRWFVLSLPIMVFGAELILSALWPGHLPPPASLLSTLFLPLLVQLLAVVSVFSITRYRPSDFLTLLTAFTTAYGLLQLNLATDSTMPVAPSYLATAYLAALFFLVRIPFRLLLPPTALVVLLVLWAQWRHWTMTPPHWIELVSQLLMFVVGSIGGHALELAHRRDWLRLQMLEATSRTDALTGIFDRRGFDEAFVTVLRLAARERRSAALVMIDLDFFKSLNDIYGHEDGDLCLRSIAQTINRFARRPLDQACRIGGEEFALTLYDCPAEILARRAEDLRAAIEALKIANVGSRVSPYVTISIGAVSIPVGAPADAREVLRQADQLLYSAKDAGRNRVAVAPYAAGRI